MNKRGQVTLFVIIGIILIILILLFFFLKEKIILTPPSIQNLENQFPQIREHIKECLVEIATPRLKQIGLQGGFINTPEDTFRKYNNQKVSYLCFNIENQPFCRSRVRRLQDMENELTQFILQDLQTQCLNLNAFDKPGLDLTTGELEITTTINPDTTLIEANYPIILRRGDAIAEQSEFSALIDVPLGRLYQTSRDIVNAESLVANFDTTFYSITKTQLTGKPYIVQKIPVYPDKLYMSKIKDTPSEDDEYIFQFWIEGEPR